MDPRSVLFVDFTGSTQLYESVGEAAGHRIVVSCLEVLSRVVLEHGGTIVDQIGDELMCTFDTAGAAALAAVALQLGVQSAKRTGDLHDHVNVRVGFHHGPVGDDGGTIFGDTVHTARRIASRAKPQQVLTTGTTIREIPVHDAPLTTFVEATRIKGRTAPVEVFEVVWDPVAATQQLEKGRGTEPRLDAVRLELTSGDAEVVLDAQHPALVIGRDAQNDLVIDDLQVSRFHCRLELQQRRITLTDMSTNGTEVHRRGGPSERLHRDEHELRGEGSLVLGRSGPETAGIAIGYRCLPEESGDADDGGSGTVV